MQVPGPSRPTDADEWSRRRVLAIGTTGLAVVSAGCSGVTNYGFRAAPVVLPAGRRAALGYETLAREPLVMERSRTVGGVDIEATIKSQVAAYGPTDPTASGTPAAPVVGVASTPPATVMGRPFNPLTRLSLPNLLTSTAGTRFLQRARLDKVGHSRSTVRWERGPRRIASRAGRCLDVDTQLHTYAGVLGGDPPSVAFVHLARVTAASVVLPVAIHGHDVDTQGRPFVGPDSGYLSPSALETAAAVFGRVTAALQYGGR